MNYIETWSIETAVSFLYTCKSGGGYIIYRENGKYIVMPDRDSYCEYLYQHPNMMRDSSKYIYYIKGRTNNIVFMYEKPGTMSELILASNPRVQVIVCGVIPEPPSATEPPGATEPPSVKPEPVEAKSPGT